MTRLAEAGSLLLVVGGVVLLVGALLMLAALLFQRTAQKFRPLYIAVAVGGIALSLSVLIPRLFD